ncbi:MAG TPA: hypothetical protein P5254_04655 [Aquihabitans sp.]|mgnify:CR=1 FL=1|nr:hypothetical protein [Aquihabitans sp.]
MSAPTAGAGRIGPVGRYVAVVALVSAVLGAVWWSGAVNPRVRVAWNGAGLEVHGRQAVRIRTIENPGPLLVHVRSVTWEPTGLADAQVRITDSGDDERSAADAVRRSSPFEPFDLPAKGRRTLVFTGTIVCLPGATQATPTAGRAVQISLAAPLGPSRSLETGWLDPGGPTLPCPVGPEG